MSQSLAFNYPLGVDMPLNKPKQIFLVEFLKFVIFQNNPFYTTEESKSNFQNRNIKHNWTNIMKDGCKSMNCI